MEFVGSLSPVWWVVIVCLCCILGAVFLFLLNFVSEIFGIVANLFEFVFNIVGGIVGGGPVIWCGCLVGLMICCGISVVALALTNIAST